MNLPDRLRLPFAFDPGLLARDLAALSCAQWIDHYITDRYEGHWDVIPLRAPPGATHPVMTIYADPNAKVFEDTAMLQACPYFREIVESFECPLRGVRLLRLTPGSRLKEHTDPDDIGRDGIVRIHVPVVTNDDVEFLLNGSRVVMDPGSAWYLRLSDRHSAINRGATDRVHMILDTVLNDWLRAVLERALDAQPVRQAV
jgi:hypothetical protein